MEKIGIFLDKKSRYIIVIFFLAFFILGLFIFKDYGISTDEYAQRNLGYNTLRLVLNADRNIFLQANRYHGTIFTLLAVWAEKIFILKDLRAIYLTKHFMVFILFFASSIAFFMLCRNIFKNWKWGLLASLMLILSPRIFADSFYNPKDLPLLSAFIISIYTMNLYLESKTTTRAVIHAIATAFTISIRILGILVPVITLIIFIADMILRRQEKMGMDWNLAAKIKSILIYFFIMIVFLLLFLPVLWENPIKNFLAIFTSMSNFEHSTHELYMGKIYNSASMPWHYLIVYVFTTTPIFYSLMFVTGLVFMFINLRKISTFYKKEKYNIIAVIWFFAPILAVIVFKSTIYNGWRQSYFIYPAFIILAINGLAGLWNLIRIKLAGTKQKITAIIFIALVSCNLIFITQLMVREHPNQFVYFNILAGKNMEEAKSRFYLDYWYVSYKQGLEYILKNDSRDVIRIKQINGPEYGSAAYIFTEEQRKRLVFVEDLEEADYVLHNFRNNKYMEFNLKEEEQVFDVKVGGAKIMEIYKLN